MAPILPGLTDRPEGIEAVIKAARAAGATGLWAGMLYLRKGTKEHFMSVWANTGPSWYLGMNRRIGREPICRRHSARRP